MFEGMWRECTVCCLNLTCLNVNWSLQLLWMSSAWNIDGCVFETKRPCWRIAFFLSGKKNNFSNGCLTSMNMKKLCAEKWSPNLERKLEFRNMPAISEMVEDVKEDAKFWYTLVSCYETRVFPYDPETKRRSAVGNCCISETKETSNDEVTNLKSRCRFFRHQRKHQVLDKCHQIREWTNSSALNLLTKLQKTVFERRPGFWSRGWLFNRDNINAQKAILVRQLLAPYLPDLAHCDPFLAQTETVPQTKPFLIGWRRPEDNDPGDVLTLGAGLLSVMYLLSTSPVSWLGSPSAM